MAQFGANNSDLNAISGARDIQAERIYLPGGWDNAHTKIPTLGTSLRACMSIDNRDIYSWAALASAKSGSGIFDKIKRTGDDLADAAERGVYSDICIDHEPWLKCQENPKNGNLGHPPDFVKAMINIVTIWRDRCWSGLSKPNRQRIRPTVCFTEGQFYRHRANDFWMLGSDTLTDYVHHVALDCYAMTRANGFAHKASDACTPYEIMTASGGYATGTISFRDWIQQFAKKNYAIWETGMEKDCGAAGQAQWYRNFLATLKAWKASDTYHVTTFLTFYSAHNGDDWRFTSLNPSSNAAADAWRDLSNDSLFDQ